MSLPVIPLPFTATSHGSFRLLSLVAQYRNREPFWLGASDGKGQGTRRFGFVTTMTKVVQSTKARVSTGTSHRGWR